MKAFHVTTFGCQMNEHDSERMKGMLESLGYARCPSARDADLILFNTCSIREKADERFVAHLHEAKALKRRDPERVIGVGGCWAQSVKEQVFRQFPFVDVAFGPGPGPQARGVPHLRLADRAGLLRVRGLHRPPARQAGARRPGVDADLRRLQLPLRLLHRALDARARGLPPAGRARRRRPQRLAADGVTRDHAARAERQRLRPRPAPGARDRSPSCCDAVDAIDGIAAHPLHEPAPEGHARGRRSARTPSSPSLCEHIHLPLQAGSSRVLKAMRRTYTRERYMDRVALIREHVPDVRADDRHHRRLPGRDRGRLRARRSRSSRRSATTAPSRSSSRRAAAPTAAAARGPRPARGEGRADAAAGRGRPAPRARASAALRRADDGGAGRGAFADRPEPPARPHAPQQGRQLRRPGRAGRHTSTSRSTRRPARRCWASRRAARARPLEQVIPSGACANMCSCAGTTSRRPRTAERCPATASRRSDLRPSTRPRRSTPASTRSGEVARSTACRRRRGCRSAGRSTRTGDAPMRALTASPGRRTSTSTSTPGATSSRRSSSRSTCPRCCAGELARPSWKREHVALGTNTDPYQWVEGRYKLMPRIWEALRDSRTPCSILTKSPLLLRDLDLLQEIAERGRRQRRLSVPTLDEKAWRATEPHTPHPRSAARGGRGAQPRRHPDGDPDRAADARDQRRPAAGRGDPRARDETGAVSIGGIMLHLRGEVARDLHGLAALLPPGPRAALRELYARGAYAPSRAAPDRAGGRAAPARDSNVPGRRWRRSPRPEPARAGSAGLRHARQAEAPEDHEWGRAPASSRRSSDRPVPLACEAVVPAGGRHVPDDRRKGKVIG